MRSSVILRVFLLILLAFTPAWPQARNPRPLSNPRPQSRAPQPKAAQFNQFSNPHIQFLDTSGRPLAGGRVFSYAAGTTTPVPTFRDSTGTAVNTNPVILDSGGFGDIWLDQTKSYKVVLQNSQGVQQWVVDNISGNISASSVPLNNITNGVATNVIQSGNNTQYWEWQLTGTTPTAGIAITEPAPSTAPAPSALLDVHTLDGSTVHPFCATVGTAFTGVCIDAAGNIQAQGAAQFRGPLVGNVTGNVAGDVTGNADTATEVPMSGLANATSQNLVLNGGYTQYWQWDLTGGGTQIGLALNESAPSTSTSPYPVLLYTETLSGSTSWPLQVIAHGPNGAGFGVSPAGDVEAIGSGRFVGPLVGDVTGNVTGTTGAFTGNVNAGSFTGPLTGNVTGNVSGTANNVTGIVAVVNGGNGTATPSLVAGTDVTITGSWPNQTINSTAGGGGMTWPAGAAGIPNYTGASAWGTSYSATNTIPANFLATIPYTQVSGTPTIPTSASWPNAGTCTAGQYGTGWTNGAAPTCAAVQYSQLGGTVPTWNQNTTGMASNVTGIVGVANGGTGTATPSLIAGTNITITGSWPNQTINSTAGGGGTALSGLTAATAANTISNSSFPQVWNWTLGSTTNSALTIGEATAATGASTLLKISALSNTVTPLDVESPNSQIHFGPTPATGSWLVSVAAGTLLAQGASYNGTNWIARSSSPSIVGTNGSNFLLNSDTGKTIGATFIPTNFAGLGASFGLQLYPIPSGGGAPQANLLASNGAWLSGNAYYNGTNWTAADSAAAMLNIGGEGALVFYANTGLTVGSTFNPTTVATLSPAGAFNAATVTTSGKTTAVGGIAVGSGVGQGTGMQHRRMTSCTTPAVSNGTCNTTLTWATPFSDVSYTAVCSANGDSGYVSVLVTASKTAAGMVVIMINWPGSSTAASTEIDCIAMHD